ncbi:sugar ABC transporter permease [Mycoplasma iguanae]|uniref:Sugar ABC transporter permease n=1 Tax=Mycoplasma iguanae TaxID=292461 RepID=A0ABY5R9D2_9MOLU|nr:sugar ABC transporter permease [Mycoplasma iguanae]UVD81901.1 sugar ABC transporter permease [Mycoplasma iguanae]
MYKKRWFFSLVAPSLTVFSIVMLIPTVMGIILSFTDWQKGKELYDNGWVGFANYHKAFQDGVFGTSIWFTFVFSIVCLILVNLIGFTIALMLNKAFYGKNLFRSVFFIPNLIGGLILGYLWQLIFDRVFIEIFGGESLRLKSQMGGMFAMAIVFAWQMSGYVMIIYLAALQSVDKNLSEASKIEGANRFRIFKNVTLPAVMPAITVSVFLVLSGSFKMFDQNLALTDGTNNTGLLSFDIYSTAFNPAYLGTYGIAQSKSFIFTLLVSAIAISQVYISKKFEVQQ